VKQSAVADHTKKITNFLGHEMPINRFEAATGALREHG
jgi:hypothetical protein